MLSVALQALGFVALDRSDPFVVVVSNDGPTDAADVVVTVTAGGDAVLVEVPQVPAPVEVPPVTASGGVAAFGEATALSCSTEANRLTCHWPVLAAGSDTEVHFKPQFAGSFDAERELTLTVTATSVGQDVPFQNGPRTLDVKVGPALLKPRARFSVMGGTAVVGNVNWACPSAEDGCTEADPDAAVDNDTDDSTTVSSSATFDLPAGATVARAVLYWGGTRSGPRLAPDANTSGPARTAPAEPTRGGGRGQGSGRQGRLVRGGR